MTVTKKTIGALIDEYVRANPRGQDVTAHVLSGLGQADVKRYANAAHKGDMDAAKKEIGKLVRELLFEKYPASKKLREVKVDSARWPGLVGWVANFTTYDIR